MPKNWDVYFIELAEWAASKSKDPSSQYGAAIATRENRVVSTGYNGLPRGVEYREELLIRPDKYFYMVHAEQNAIFNAAALGTPTAGCRIYLLKPPCAECAKAIVQCGLSEVIFKTYHEMVDVGVPPRGYASIHDWRQTLDAAMDILGEGGLTVRKADLA